MTDRIEPKIAAAVLGDGWLDAEQCAVVLGMFTPKGRPSKLGFLRRVACQPDFPRPMQIGQHRAWRKAEVDQWAMNQRRSA